MNKTIENKKQTKTVKPVKEWLLVVSIQVHSVEL